MVLSSGTDSKSTPANRRIDSTSYKLSSIPDHSIHTTVAENKSATSPPPEWDAGPGRLSDTSSLSASVTRPRAISPPSRQETALFGSSSSYAHRPGPKNSFVSWVFPSWFTFAYDLILRRLDQSFPSISSIEFIAGLIGPLCNFNALNCSLDMLLLRWRSSIFSFWRKAGRSLM